MSTTENLRKDELIEVRKLHLSAGELSNDELAALAKALAPRIRVNGIGPGPTLASIHQDDAAFAEEAAGTLLGRPVAPGQIGAALRYLIDAEAVTGQMIAVDSGQHLS